MQLGIGAEGPIRGRRVAVTGLGSGHLLRGGGGGSVGRTPQPFGRRRASSATTSQRTGSDPRRCASSTVLPNCRWSRPTWPSRPPGTLAVDPAKAGVIFATGVGGFETLADQVGVYNAKGPRPCLAPAGADDDGQCGSGRHLNADGLARSLRGHLHRVRSRDTRHCRCGPSDCVRSLRRRDRRRVGGEHAPGCDCGILQHDRSLDIGSFSSLRHSPRRLRDDRGRGGARARGLGPCGRAGVRPFSPRSPVRPAPPMRITSPRPRPTAPARWPVWSWPSPTPASPRRT